ncbi:hypothetical protein BVE84_08855 [Streptococcus azizii]|uniref:YopX protein domain-containing protein n=1 Tax=Streptococcus azizii TaxID=1579424 RepID=A0AB36JNA7_9STRE|nr:MULTISPECIES: hypothetical protein [Streptococcus]MBF0776544.1 hypothetical protein [Streptococcus sp. 19428wD3_AN2]ONK26447.1 hypothetical protein BVE86_07180 [Streptococcus azizii]ONK26709.1 hypothetical protein BVE84_08855 [Streptococcus azizii]ONK26973.1 hypothetical protein BVE85_07165 [Streptococcus azizii]TFU82763.1 hypothetical protein E4T83_07165 [Streptococcus sp. AN2]
MEIQSKIEAINNTDYWDAQILDIRANYLGDEITVYIECFDLEEREIYCWELKYLRCAKVSYETDAGHLVYKGDQKVLWRHEDVKNLRDGQLYGYAGHTITLTKYDEFLIRCKLVLSLISMDIICQDIEVSKVLIADQHFFWDEDR